MADSQSPQSVSSTGRVLVGVALVYCKDGKLEKPVWIDMDKVPAITWSPETLGERPAGPTNGKNKFAKATEPTDCPKSNDVPTDGICWWDGKQWICGD